MKERPILFSGAMVRAILAGRKTQTRRVVKAPKHQSMHGRSTNWGAAFADSSFDGTVGQYLKLVYGGGDLGPDECTDRVFCPYGVIGDRLWVRESGWQSEGRFFAYDATKGVARCSDDAPGYYIQVSPEEAESWDKSEWRHYGWKRTPSIHMPRWASRMALEITGVRAERVQDISSADAIAEGIYQCESGFWWSDPTTQDYLHRDRPTPDGFNGGAVDAYRDLWDSINGTRPGCSWEANPWVWCVEFKRVEQEAAR